MNIRSKRHHYKVSEFVFKKLNNPYKIQDLYAGPFKIIKISRDNNVVVIDEKSKISRQNIKNITPFFIKKGEDFVVRQGEKRD